MSDPNIKIYSPRTERKRLELRETKIKIEDKKYDNTWKSACFTLDRRAIRFFTQLFIGLVIIFFCIFKLMDENLSCESSNTYISLLSTTIAIFLPSPTI
jgi:hypothetical protein